VKSPTDHRKISKFQLGLLIAILFLGLFLRVYKLDTLPDGFFCDEASLGYNAWAILHHGIDETGASYPLYATSLGVHKNPVFVYSSMIPIGLFGLSEWSVRLTSAVFGFLTIAAVFWLLFEIHGTLAGLIGAMLLAILPWNLHFSRIAFELIAWPCLFTAGLAAFLRGCRIGGYSFLWAGLFWGLSLHSYVMALTFIPIFLLFTGIVYFKPLLKNYRWVIAGLILFILLTLPAVKNHLDTQDNLHFQTVNWWATSKDQPLQTRLKQLWDNYHPFFSYEFLVTSGDNNPRHSLAHHGPIYNSLFFLSIAGLLTGLLPPKRHYLLLLLWTILYPLGAALTIDRYTTRSIIGCPLAPIWSAMAMIWIICLINKIKWRWLKYPCLVLIFTPFLGFVARDSYHYMKRYHNEYNLQSACGIYGFQYGYKELIEFSEPLRSTFDQFLWTAHNVNEPYIFPLFYNKIDPKKYVQDHDIGYEIFRAFEFSRYDLDKPTLFAVRTDELIYFDDYTVHFELIGFDNTPQFTVIEPRSRRTYVDQWSFLGLWRKDDPRDCDEIYPDPTLTYGTTIDSINGPAYWETAGLMPPLVNIQALFRDSDPDNPRNPEFVEAAGASWMYFKEAFDGYVEVFGSYDTMAIWLNGQQIMSQTTLKTSEVVTIPFQAEKGWNEMAIKTCEGVGDWFFIMTLTDKNKHGITPYLSRATPPGFDEYPLTSNRHQIEIYGGIP